ncbi:MAG TPA: glycoside hydrolase family 1 protein [bacterium]|nr:glycoside hydrolase family 1 protein [bacterium]
MLKSNKVLKMPDGFLWGTATAAHQVEGNNINSDWWQWEQKNVGKILDVKEKKFRNKKFEPSGLACDHYSRFEEDFKLIEELGNNAHRLSIEWARIEAEEGKLNLAELEHYRQVLESLKNKKIKVMLTLNHFTLPSWLADKGGWTNFKSPFYFNRYATFVAKNLGHLVDFWITINEPEIYMDMSYMSGFWPPQKKDIKLAGWVYFNMARAHKKVYKNIHKILDKKGHKTQVGFSMNVMSFASYRKHNFWELFFVHAADRIVNHSFYDLTKKSHDFLGVNYYFRVRLKKNEGSLIPAVDEVHEDESELSDMGWVVYSHGIFDVLMDFKDFNLPIYITENGIATEDEDQRAKFISNHLAEIHHAIQAGVDVRGYFYWSLLDNFEWDKSFGPKFGLVAVDRKKKTRKPKESFYAYQKICQTNTVRPVA